VIQTNKIEYLPSMDGDLRDLIGKILIKEAQGRLTMDQIMEHPWIKSKIALNVEYLPKTNSSSINLSK
jgi:serine/threonine protein kinase